MRKTPKSRKKLSPAKRLARYRARAKRSGVRRLEVSARKANFDRIRRFARLLEAGGPVADSLCRQIDAGLDKPFKVAKTGAEFLDGTRRILYGDAGHLKIAKTGGEFLDMVDQYLGEDGGVRLELPPREYEEPRDTGF